MELTRKDKQCFSVTSQEEIEQALGQTGATYELCNYANVYEVQVTSQAQMREVLTTVERVGNLNISI